MHPYSHRVDFRSYTGMKSKLLMPGCSPWAGASGATEWLRRWYETPTLLIRELSVGVRNSEVVPLRYPVMPVTNRDRKSTRLNSSHLGISYAVFCLKKKKTS